MITRFISLLEQTPKGDLFNPWFDRDADHDQSSDAPFVRRRQLQTYLEERLESASVLFIAEALGYQGGHFTGIAMTSERILLGHQRGKYGIRPEHVFRNATPERTSREEVVRNGLSEPTATIMWSSLIDMGIDPYRAVLWNALPWHPFESEKGMLSNRTPTGREMEAGFEVLKQFLNLFQGARVVAVGRKCEQAMRTLGVEHDQVRHPANGGAPRFRKQVAALFNG